MLTNEAIEERAWCGLSTLRRLLGDKRHSFENGLYLTSVSDSEIDLFPRVTLLALLTSHHRDTLSHAIRGEPTADQRQALASAVMSDLDQLNHALHFLGSRLEAMGREIRSLQGDIARAVTR
jgi:hypothetical protein